MRPSKGTERYVRRKPCAYVDAHVIFCFCHFLTVVQKSFSLSWVSAPAPLPTSHWYIYSGILNDVYFREIPRAFTTR